MRLLINKSPKSRHHARDVLLRIKSHGAVLVLVSNTYWDTGESSERGLPFSWVDYQRANLMLKFRRWKQTSRIFRGRVYNFTPILLEKIRERLARKEQVVLMLNRRSYSFCHVSRLVAMDDCPNCDISLTLHMDTKNYECYYCDFQKVIPHVCPNCQSRQICYYGTGTQKADRLTELLPEARVIRMDVDADTRKVLEKLLETFGNRLAFCLGSDDCQGLDFQMLPW